MIIKVSEKGKEYCLAVATHEIRIVARMCGLQVFEAAQGMTEADKGIIRDLHAERGEFLERMDTGRQGQGLQTLADRMLAGQTWQEAQRETYEKKGE